MIRHLRRLFGSPAVLENHIAAHIYSERGGTHTDNEDAVEARLHDRDNALWVCCLADGQGGQSGGARAAYVAVQASLAAALAQPTRSLLKPKICESIVRAADNAVYADSQAGFTTLVMFAIRDQFVCGASCGDSAAVLLQSTGPVILTEAQLSHPTVGSRATRAVSFCLNLDPPWHICAMSDGVWKYVGWDRIIALMRRKSGRDLVDTLRDAAIGPGKSGLPDDFSIASFTYDPGDR